MSSIPDLALAALLAAVALLISYGATRALIDALASRAILDRPNERSSHVTPTPRGGGIGVLAALLPAWLFSAHLFPNPPDGIAVIVTLALALALVSWADDLQGLGPALRLAAQVATVAVVLITLPFPTPVFGGLLPPALDIVASALLWLWFINLFNFMDGIDGIAGVQTAGVGIGVFIVAKMAGMGGAWQTLGLTAAAAVGFLRWNWHPAKVFLGDVGSVPLGFLLGWLLLGLAAHGHPAPALILPMYFLADATITLVRRALRGEKVWTAHRLHFYQQAVQAGLGHNEVARTIAYANVVLVLLAIASLEYTWLPVLIAICVVGALLLYLARQRPTGSR